MAIKNDTSGTHLSNATMEANAFEVRVTGTVGSGREVIRQAGQNSSAAAHAFEGRVTQESGSHLWP